MTTKTDPETYILTAEAISDMEGRAKTHFLNPNAKRINKSLGDAVGLTGFGFHLIEVEPGHDTTEYHFHHYEDECVYVLSGAATALIGDMEYAIKAGDFIGYRKGGQAHSIRNTGDDMFRCLVVGERLAHDVCDYPNQKKRLFRNQGLIWDLADQDDLKNPSAGKEK